MANYEFEVVGWDASVGGGIRYVGDYTTDFRIGARGGGGINFPVDSYSLMDLNYNMTEGAYSVSLYVTNVLDNDALGNATAFDSFPSPIATGNPVRPRTIGAVVSMSF